MPEYVRHLLEKQKQNKKSDLIVDVKIHLLHFTKLCMLSDGGMNNNGMLDTKAFFMSFQYFEYVYLVLIGIIISKFGQKDVAGKKVHSKSILEVLGRDFMMTERHMILVQLCITIQFLVQKIELNQ